MKYDVTHILTSLKNEVKGTKRTSRDTKNENERRKYLIQLDVVFKKKPMAKSVIYLLFSYQTGYINVTFPAYDIYSLRLRLREYRS